MTPSDVAYAEPDLVGIKNKKGLPIPMLVPLSHLAMPTVLSIILPLSGLFLIRILLGLRRVCRDVGSV